MLMGIKKYPNDRKFVENSEKMTRNNSTSPLSPRLKGIFEILSLKRVNYIIDEVTTSYRI